VRYDEYGSAVPHDGRESQPYDEPTWQTDQSTWQEDQPTWHIARRAPSPGPDRTMPLLPQDHSRSVTVGGALPQRFPSPRRANPYGGATVAYGGTSGPHDAGRQSGTQSRITLRIGKGVAAVERSRRMRKAAQNARARAWRIGNITLTVVIVAAAIWAGWEWWQRWHPQLRVEGVTVTVTPPTDACNGSYDLLGTIATNGKAGSVSYQWVRSDGAATKRLNVNVPDGQRTTAVHLPRSSTAWRTRVW
jgi:hypothetical protein